MNKLCIFDLDGTLTDTLTAIAHFGNSALYEAMGKAPIEKEKYKRFVGDGRDVLIHRILAYYDADTEENFTKTRSVYDRLYEADPMYKTAAYDGISQMLDKLKGAGIRIAVCSNKPDNVVHDVVKTIFGDIFDCVAGVVPGQKTKPAPDSAFRIMHETDTDAQNTVFVGDTNVDIFTAKNACVKSIGVLWGFRDREELESAGADMIAETPSELLDILMQCFAR